MFRKKKCLRYLALGTVLFFTGNIDLQAQLETPPALTGNHNQVSIIGFDNGGNSIGKTRSFFNSLGKPTQRQNWDVVTRKIWADETLYDRHGRSGLKTLSAPIGNKFGYVNNFILDGSNNAYTTADFDQGSTVANPSAVGSGSLLRAYYSSTNTADHYQDITAYPFLRTVYSDLVPGSTHQLLGGNRIGGAWKQTYAFSMSSGTELAAANAFGNSFDTSRRVIKAVSRDVHNVDIVLFVDSDGKTLAAARSGNEEGTVALHTNTISIGEQGFVDIHIPQGISSFSVSNPDPSVSGALKVYNLITEQSLSPITGSSATRSAASGFYRIAVTNPMAYSQSESGPITVTHQVNYYDYSLNEYDKTHRLISSKQPLNHLESNFTYNTLGSLLNYSNPDEGYSQFHYRKDGQLRFSQNEKQAPSEHFSYTNFVIYARPVESGVFNGKNAGMSFSSAAAIVDQLDGLADAHCTERRHTVYDIPDRDLPHLLKECEIRDSEYKQTFLAGNVSKTWTAAPHTTTTWYSYDVQGRVRWIVQSIPDMTCLKTIDYEYDPTTALVTKVDYQRHSRDERFVHRYRYNAARQLVSVETSPNDSYYTLQAQYFYNESGELVRTVLAKDLQGIDYVYNLDGQLKAINHPSLKVENDPGRDGDNGIRGDVFGLSLDYYNGDYTRPNTPTPVAQQNTHGVDQFNGNVKSLRFNTEDLPTRSSFNAYLYEYNKNSWLKEAKYGAGSISSISGGRFKVNYEQDGNRDYEVSNITYDANGNLQRLRRNAYTDEAGDNRMDNFVYHYDNGNQLQEVEDLGDNSDPIRYNDLKDQNNNDLPNYKYNKIGQLEVDMSNRSLYEYNTAGLVTKINTFGKLGTGENYSYYLQNHSTAPASEAATWTVSPGSAALNATGQYAACTGCAPCVTLGNRHSQSMRLDMYDGGLASKTYDVIPNLLQAIRLEMIVYQKNDTGYKISVLDEDNHVLTSTSFNLALNYIDDPDISETACRSFYDEREELTFTPPSGKVTLLIEAVSESPLTPMYIDDIELITSVVPKLAYYYNDRNHRVRKEVYDNSGNTFKTHYVRDATGLLMGLYTNSEGETSNDALRLKEHGVYGLSQIGLLYRDNHFEAGGLFAYQLIDHQGNVRAVLMKNEENVIAITNKTDYYPFGMPMPGRQETDGNYRYAYQGQEKDEETGMEAFEARLWESRIGRWLTVDPHAQFNSPYLGMGNNMNAIDPDGRDVILLYDNNAPFGSGFSGHTAILIGNDQDGWTYYNKNGNTAEDGSGEIEVESFKSINEFYERYASRGTHQMGFHVKTSKDIDKTVKDKADEIVKAKKPYGLSECNCANFTKNVLKAGGFDTGKPKKFLWITWPRDEFISFSLKNRKKGTLHYYIPESPVSKYDKQEVVQRSKGPKPVLDILFFFRINSQTETFFLKGDTGAKVSRSPRYF